MSAHRVNFLSSLNMPFHFALIVLIIVVKRSNGSPPAILLKLSGSWETSSESQAMFLFRLSKMQHNFRPNCLSLDFTPSQRKTKFQWQHFASMLDQVTRRIWGCPISLDRINWNDCVLEYGGVLNVYNVYHRSNTLLHNPACCHVFFVRRTLALTERNNSLSIPPAVLAEAMCPLPVLYSASILTMGFAISIKHLILCSLTSLFVAHRHIKSKVDKSSRASAVWHHHDC